jgi:hypothetical protein
MQHHPPPGKNDFCRLGLNASIGNSQVNREA